MPFNHQITRLYHSFKVQTEIFPGISSSRLLLGCLHQLQTGLLVYIAVSAAIVAYLKTSSESQVLQVGQHAKRVLYRSIIVEDFVSFDR